MKLAEFYKPLSLSNEYDKGRITRSNAWDLAFQSSYHDDPIFFVHHRPLLCLPLTWWPTWRLEEANKGEKHCWPDWTWIQISCLVRMTSSLLNAFYIRRFILYSQLTTKGRTKRKTCFSAPPKLHEVTPVVLEGFMSRSAPVIARAQQCHNEEMRQIKLPWWRKLWDEDEVEWTDKRTRAVDKEQLNFWSYLRCCVEYCK